MANEVLQFTISVDAATGIGKIEQFGKATQKVAAESGAAAKSLNTSWTTVQSTLATFGVAFGAASLISFLKSSFVEAARTERQFGGLAAQITAMGKAAHGTSAETRAFIDRLSDQSKILDDDLIPAMERLFRATEDVQASQYLLDIAARFAANGIGTVQENADKLALALVSGTSRSLKDFITHAKDAQGNLVSVANAFGQVETKVAGLSLVVNDSQRKVDALAHAWDGVRDSIHNALNEFINWTNSFKDPSKASEAEVIRLAVIMRGGVNVNRAITPEEMANARYILELQKELEWRAEARAKSAGKLALAEQLATNAVKERVKVERLQTEFIQPEPWDRQQREVWMGTTGYTQAEIEQIQKLLSGETGSAIGTGESPMSRLFADSKNLPGVTDSFTKLREEMEKTLTVTQGLAAASDALGAIQGALESSTSGSAQRAAERIAQVRAALAIIQGAFEAAEAIKAAANYDYYAAAQHGLASVKFFAVGAMTLNSAGGGSGATGGSSSGGGGGRPANTAPSYGTTYNVPTGGGGRGSGGGVTIVAWDGASVERWAKQPENRRILQGALAEGARKAS